MTSDRPEHVRDDPGCSSCGTCIGCDSCADPDNPLDEGRGDCAICGACGPCIAECTALRARLAAESTEAP